MTQRLTIQGPDGEAIALEATFASAMEGKLTTVNWRAAVTLAGVTIGGSVFFWAIFVR